MAIGRRDPQHGHHAYAIAIELVHRLARGRRWPRQAHAAGVLATPNDVLIVAAAFDLELGALELLARRHGIGPVANLAQPKVVHVDVERDAVGVVVERAAHAPVAVAILAAK